MPALDHLLEAFAGMSLAVASGWLLVINIAMFIASVFGGELLVRIFRARRISPPPDPIDFTECWLAFSCVLLNALVAVAGWLLWRHGWITVRRGGGWRILMDIVVLLIAMDFLMYVFHRIAHLPWIFPIVHSTHHHYDRPRPLSLFVLNPAEVLGFGLLWLLLLCVYTATWTGIIVYLALNLLFGTIGHLGVEPFPRALSNRPILRHLGSSTFHATHHSDRNVNFGFYTDFWDRLFGTTGSTCTRAGICLLVGSLFLYRVQIGLAQGNATPRQNQAWSLPLSTNATAELLWIPPGTFTMGSPATVPISKLDEPRAARAKNAQAEASASRGFRLVLCQVQ
jgi:sterol desaturase/sphingolipid hydroxylase (fatty acid hydroxylase superfamily)